MQTLAELGAWNWMILAAILFVLELTAPGIFFMWFGVAAVATGLIAFGFDVGWQWQLVWFCLLVGRLRGASRGNICASIRSRASGRCSTSVPCSHIGESHDLDRPIVNGRGSVKIGDSIWRVTGPELPRGARVTVVGADGTLLKVVPAGNGGRGLARELRYFDLLDGGDLVGDLCGCVGDAAKVPAPRRSRPDPETLTSVKPTSRNLSATCSLEATLLKPSLMVAW